MNYFRNCCSPPIAPRVARLAARCTAQLVDALLPQRCALCSQSSAGGGAAVCGDCQRALPRLPASCCPRCADFSAAGLLCGRCLTSPPAFDRVLSPFVYAEPVDVLIQALKYRHRLHLARWFGRQLAATLAADPAGERFDAILPLPLHPARLKHRGFNQAIEIARPLARSLGRPLSRRAAVRVRDTAPQAALPREDRRRNLVGAFECVADFKDQAILVVDDVLTTGSSADELARVLKLHGARRVVVAAAARTLHAA